MEAKARPKRPDSEGLRRGEEKAWREFVLDYSPRLFRYFRSVLLEDQEAEDLVGETLTAVLSQIAHFRGEASLETWVFRIGRNKLYDRRLRFRRWKRLLGAYLPFQRTFARQSRDPEDAALLQDDLEQIEEALGRLPLKHREVFGLRFVQELSIKEVAEILGLTEHQVKNYTRDGRKMLQRHFEALSGASRAFPIPSERSEL